MHVYRPYIHPRLGQRLSPPFFLDAAIITGGATAGAQVTVQAAGVSLGAATAQVAVAVQAQQGNFQSTASASASCVAGAQAAGVVIATNALGGDAVHAQLQAVAVGGASVAAHAQATVAVSVQATGVRVAPGASTPVGADARNFIERKVTNAAEYRFSNGTRTRDFFQRKP